MQKSRQHPLQPLHAGTDVTTEAPVPDVSSSVKEAPLVGTIGASVTVIEPDTVTMDVNALTVRVAAPLAITVLVLLDE